MAPFNTMVEWVVWVLVTFPTIRETIQFFQNRTWLFFVVVMVLVLAQYLPKPRRPIL